MSPRSVLIALLVASAMSLPAQETRGSIAGRITDPAAMPVSDCPVIVANADTGAIFHATSNASGYYEVNLLIPGRYEVTVKATGFKQVVRKGITLSVATRLDVAIVLELGSVSETVSVTADAPLLETDSGSSGRVIDSHVLNDAPVLNNMSLLLADFTPGVQTAGVNSWVSYHSGGGGLVYSVNAGVGGNDFSIDGVANNSGRSAAFIPHTEAIAEFRMETSGFDASMGHSTGIGVSMMTKAGTNRYHGSLTETHWNQQWQAAPFFVRQLYYTNINAAKAKGDLDLANKLASRSELPDGYEHNYAATIGGPVQIPKLINGRNKLFFFFAYNGFVDSRAEEANTFNRTVPGVLEKKGDFSQLLQAGAKYQVYDPLTVAPNPARPGQMVRQPFPGNVLPASRIINPLYKLYGGFYPDPNNILAATQDPTNNYLASQMKWDLNYKGITNRFDFNASEKHRFFGRWNWFAYHETRSDWTYETTPGPNVNAQGRGDLGASIDWTYAASPTTLFDFAVGSSSRLGISDPKLVQEYTPSKAGFPTYMDDRAGGLHSLPIMSISGYNGMSQNFPSRDKNRLLTFNAKMFHTRGNHSISTGGEFRGHYKSNFGGGPTSGNFNFDNFYTRKDGDGLTTSASLGLSWAAFMMGLPTNASMGVIDSFTTFNPYAGWFVQDKWRITPRLSVTLGFRVEYEAGPTERFNRSLVAFDPTLSLPITAAAQANYTAAPVAEMPASAFSVLGGSYYAGDKGHTRKIWQNELMVMPRVAFAYSLRRDIVIRGGYGMFYDSNNAHNFSPDLSGYNRTTTTTFSTDFGQTWASGNPAAGISPLTDPFPVRADGSRWDDPTSNLLGSMTKAGSAWTFTDFNLRHPRQQRGVVSIQKQFKNNDLIDLSYSGSYSDRLAIGKPLQPLGYQYWWHEMVRDNATASNMNLAVPNPFYIGNFVDLKTSAPVIYQSMSGNSFFTSRTIGKNRLLRAFPQMNGLIENTSIGEAKSNAFIASYVHRFSHGLMVQAGYTAMYAKTRDYYLNEYDAEPSWRSTNNTRPQRFTLITIYDLPFGRNRAFLKHGLAGKIVGNWKLSNTYSRQPGPLLSWGNIFYYGSLNDIPNSNPTLPQWFNTGNFERNTTLTPAGYQARLFPTVVDGVRGDKTNQLNSNIQREFRFKERYSLQARIDVINVFNRSQMDNPSTDPTNSNFGRVVAQTTAQNRFLQVQVRFRF